MLIGELLFIMFVAFIGIVIVSLFVSIIAINMHFRDRGENDRPAPAWSDHYDSPFILWHLLTLRSPKR